MSRITSTLTLSLALLAFAPVGAEPAAETADTPNTFDTLFTQFLDGNAETAVQAFSQWTPERVEREAVLSPVQQQDAYTAAALALLHTEAGIRNSTFGKFRPDAGLVVNLGGWGLENAFEVHSYRAYRLMERVIQTPELLPDLESVVRSWYVIAISHCLRHGLPCVDGLHEKAEFRLGDDDPEIRLLTGSIAETIAYVGGNYQTTLEPIVTPHGRIGGARQLAEWSFRRLLKQEPAHVEARLRLGRLLFMLNRNTDAQPELEEALHQAGRQNHLFGRHLGAFFLGELHEQEDRIDDAVRYYRMAVDELPFAHTASIALGQLLVRHKDPGPAWLGARRMFGSEGPGVSPVLDPYAIYRGAQTYLGGSRVRAMRAIVRQHAVKPQ